MPPRQRRPAEPATEAQSQKQGQGLCPLALWAVSLPPRQGDEHCSPGYGERPSGLKAATEAGACLGRTAGKSWPGMRSELSHLQLTPLSAVKPQYNEHPSPPVVSHLKCWAPLQTQWILLSNRASPAFSTSSPSRICSLGSGLYLIPQLLLFFQQTFVERLPLEPGPLAKFREIWFPLPRNSEERNRTPDSHEHLCLGGVLGEEKLWKQTDCLCSLPAA